MSHCSTEMAAGSTHCAAQSVARGCVPWPRVEHRQMVIDKPPGSSGRRATFERGRRGDVKEGMAFPADLISSRFPAHITVS